MWPVLLSIGGGILGFLPSYYLAKSTPGSRFSERYEASYALPARAGAHRGHEFSLSVGGEVELPFHSGVSGIAAILPSFVLTWDEYTHPSGPVTSERYSAFSIPLRAEIGVRLHAGRGLTFDALGMADYSWWGTGTYSRKSPDGGTRRQNDLDALTMWHAGAELRLSYEVLSDLTLGTHVGWLHSEKALEAAGHTRHITHGHPTVGLQLRK